MLLPHFFVRIKQMKRLVVYSVLVFAIGILSLAGIFSGLFLLETETAPDEPALGAETERGTYRVISITDGDTVRIDYEGKSTPVRLIGIDTPELNSGGKKECFAAEAKAKLTQLLEGKDVRIEFDESQGTHDKYNRLLLYLWSGEELINKTLIAEGFAFEYTYDLPYRYQDQFKKAENDARTGLRGLWGDACRN
jgi:micrococcal nuclease